MNTTDNIIVAIEDGHYDHLLSDIIDTVNVRRKILADRNARSLSVGDTVEFSDQISPKYLRGLSATIVKINRKTVVVDCPADPEYGRFSGSKNVKCPNTLIVGA